MDRFFKVVLAAAFACTYAYSQSTNITGTGSETIGFTDLNFVGETGGDAAVLDTLLSFGSTNTSYQGGAGDNLSGIVALDAGGGSGLRIMSVSSSSVSGSEASGADAGSVVQENPGNPALAVGGNGVEVGVNGLSPFAPAVSLEVEGLTARGGDGGNVTAEKGSFQSLADGGSGISILNGKLQMEVTDSMLYGGDGGTIRSGGDEESSAKGGSALSIQKKPFTKFESAHVSNVMAYGGKGGSVTTLGDADASGGSGFGITQPSDLVVVESGTYVGGVGGSASQAASAVADGGDGVRFIGNATAVNSLVISNGTFQGAAGGTLKDITGSASANGGNGLYAEYATVDIFSGDFSGSAAGSADGVSGDEGVGLRASNSIVTVHGGSFDAALFDGTSTLSLEKGAIAGNLIFNEAIDAQLSLGTDLDLSGAVVQRGGTVNVNAWSDDHFKETAILDGTMNFSGQAFNLQDGSYIALAGAGSGADFGGGFTSQSNSMIATAWDKGVSESKITGTDLEFKEGTQWMVDGGDSAVANGDTITMATASGTLLSGVTAGDVEYIGSQGSWLAGITTVDAVGQNLQATYGFTRFEDALDANPNSEYGKALSAISDFTDIANSGDTEYLAIKDSSLSQAQADGYMKSVAGSPEMASTLIQAQQLFSDQIRDRSRSYLRFKNVGAPAAAPEGAAGPMEVPTTFQLWARAYGGFISQGENDGFVGYDSTIGGAVVAADKRFEKLLFGVGGGYTRSDLKGNFGSNGEADTLNGTVYATLNNEKAFLDLQLFGAFHDVETKGSAVTGGMEGEYDAGTASFYIGGGMGFPVYKDKLVVTPEASLLSTFYARDGYTEKQTTDPLAGAWPDKVYESADQFSSMSALGATLSMVEKIEALNLEMGFQPEVRAHWLHEFNADPDNEKYLMGATGGAYTAQEAVLQAREEDLIKLGLGVRFGAWESDELEFGLDLDVLFGEDYEAYIGSAKALVRF